jgi:hypothetical protein
VGQVVVREQFTENILFIVQQLNYHVKFPPAPPKNKKGLSKDRPFFCSIGH